MNKIMLVYALFRQFGRTLFWFFDIAGLIQYTYIVGKYKIHLHSLRNRTEKLSFLPVSKAHTNKFNISVLTMSTGPPAQDQ